VEATKALCSSHRQLASINDHAANCLHVRQRLDVLPVARAAQTEYGAPQGSSVLVELAGLPAATKSKTAELTAMRHFEFRDEFTGVAAQRFVALTTCGDDCRKTNHF
jgi:hypothetical protein